MSTNIGTDTLDFDGSDAGESTDIAAGGDRVRFFRDVAAVTMNFNDVQNHPVQGTRRQRPHPCAGGELLKVCREQSETRPTICPRCDGRHTDHEE